MAVFVHTWNAAFEAAPADTEAANLGASRIRDFKLAVSERAEIDHNWNGGTDDGEHKQVTLGVPLAGDPTNVADKGFLYTKDISAVIELFWEDESGNVVQLTTLGKLIGPMRLANTAVIEALEAGGTARSILSMAADDDVQVGIATNDLDLLGLGTLKYNADKVLIENDPITTRGDIIRGSSAALAERLAIGASGQVLTSDGTDVAWGIATSLIRITTFTGSGTWTDQGDIGSVEVELRAGGGGGGGSNSSSVAAAGGGQGGRSVGRIAVASLGATETVTINAGGTGGSSGGGVGGTGGSVSFGAHLSATGGLGGDFTTTQRGGAGGAGSGGDLDFTGAPGGNANNSSTDNYEVSGNGGGEGGGRSIANVQSAGLAGVDGGGGSGARGGLRAGGAGGDGWVIVREYA